MSRDITVRESDSNNAGRPVPVSPVRRAEGHRGPNRGSNVTGAAAIRRTLGLRTAARPPPPRGAPPAPAPGERQPGPQPPRRTGRPTAQLPLQPDLPAHRRPEGRRGGRPPPAR